MDKKVRKLTSEELDNQLNDVVRFLGAVHPNLKGTKGYRPCVELRPLLRGISKESKDYFPLTWSLKIWDLSEDTIKRIRNFLVRHNGQQTCLFYSVFTFDDKKKVQTKEGVPAKTGKITTAAAIFAEEIALDFDNIGFDEYTELIDRFEELGIYALWTFSGHGYQAHILLNQPLEEKEILKKVVYKFRSKGFDCDAKCTDPARIMRLPGTFNNKCFDDDEYASERVAPPKCTVVQETSDRFSLEYIFEKLDSLPTVSVEDESVFLNVSAKAAPAATVSEDKVQEVNYDISLKRLEYPYISRFELPLPINSMLSHTPKGYRNSVLGFMIRFLKNDCKFSKKQIFEILEIWSENACEPVYDKAEFEEDFKRIYYNYNGLPYDSALAQKFGNINFDVLKELNDFIYIPDKFFEDLSNLKGKEVRLYLGIKMLEHIEKDTTQEELSKLLGISDRALRPSIQNLIKRGHCYIKKGNSRQGIPNTYHSSRLVSSEGGCVTFSINDISVYIRELCEQTGRTRGNGELVLYLYFKYKFYTKQFFISQSKLAVNTGLTQPAISQVVARLQDRYFIKVKKIRQNQFIEFSEYTLLR